MHRVDIATARAHSTAVVFQRFFRMPCEDLIPPSLGLDAWAYGTGGETWYGAVLAKILAESQIWASNEPAPHLEVLSFQRSLLRAEW